MHVQFRVSQRERAWVAKPNDDDYFYYYYREVAGWQQQCKLGSYFSAFPPHFFQPSSLVIDPVVEAKSKKKQWKMTLVFGGGSVRVFLLSALYGTVRSMQRKSWRLLILASSCLCPPAYLVHPLCVGIGILLLYKAKNCTAVQQWKCVCDAFCFLFSISCRTMAFQKPQCEAGQLHIFLSRFSFSLFCWHAVITSLNTSTHMWQWKEMEGWWRNQRMKRSGEKKKKEII